MTQIRVGMITEGTYPYVTGGVSTWCQQLVSCLADVTWSVLPVTAGGQSRVARFPLPPNVSLLPTLELWSSRQQVRSRPPRSTLPASLAAGLLDEQSDLDDLSYVLGWCLTNPGAVRPSFRSSGAWRQFKAVVEDHFDTQGIRYSIGDAAELYQTMYWIAVAASTPLPAVDLILPTAAGWPAIIAAAHHQVRGTPVLLVEHGLYVRESYLGAVRSEDTAARRMNQTRLAMGMTRLAYHCADVISPVTATHAVWELSVGADSDKLHPIPNGIRPTEDTLPLPGTNTVVTVGRIDPLKDVHTMLRVAAEVLRRRPQTTFIHYGPVSPGQHDYHASCLRLHEKLGLGQRFTFAGPVPNARRVIRDADVFLSTSISEGMPIAMLEAMTEARPVVATAVGGVRDVVVGSGLTAPPGDVSSLASSVTTLLSRPSLSAELGDRGAARVRRIYNEEFVMGEYHRLLTLMTAPVRA